VGYKTGEGRTQSALFPVMLDELVPQESIVRVIDAWVDSLDLRQLGFTKARPAATGRPPYHPGDLLKLYLYGYLGVVRSSRRLERECQRNVELMWMLGRLSPDHKTIAEFRRTQSAALVATAAAFVKFAREHRLVVGDTVAIDGSKLRAVASHKAVAGADTLQQQDQALQERITKYLRELDQVDASERDPQPERAAIEESLQALRERSAQVQSHMQALQQSKRTTRVLTEPDARPMKSLHGAPGYNLQSAVDVHSHLIVHHEVVDDASDLQQLAPMAQATAAALQRTDIEVLADAGYSSGEHLQKLQDCGMDVVLPPARAVNNHGDGTLYERSMFEYDRHSDTYRCPAGQILKRRSQSLRDKQYVYAPDKGVCGTCAHQPHCTRTKRRWVTRSFFEDALQRTAEQLQQRPDAMQRRQMTVEHPFGTIKDHILGNARLLVRGIAGAKAELSLAVLAYNLKRAINLKGAAWMAAAARA
jgi:transposase